ncbi:MAG: hypothetical protein JXA46_02845 [Dehalococcoidales bacterium]|nr:hypothetical protein [Dehalococcoidales bacterium]
MSPIQWLDDQHFANYNESLNQGLSILDLVNSGTVDCKLSALLWILMEQQASIIVASMPVFAGKSTLLHALLDFLPSDLPKINLKGYFEDFEFLESSPQEKSYLIAEEISNHGFFEYLWGFKAVVTFKLLAEGYKLGTTMHARNSQEAIYILHKVLGISFPLISHLGIIVNLHATAGRTYWDDPIRRVSSVDLILPHEEGLAIQVLAARQYTEKGFEYQNDKILQKALAGKSLAGKYQIYAEIEKRKHYLRHLLRTGRTSRCEVREAVRSYHRLKTE